MIKQTGHRALEVYGHLAWVSMAIEKFRGSSWRVPDASTVAPVL